MPGRRLLKTIRNGTLLNRTFLNGDIHAKFSNRSDDAWYMQHAPGKGFMTLVSPWFFIRRASGDVSQFNVEIFINNTQPMSFLIQPGNNRYLRSDNFMYRSRWEQLIKNRDSLQLVEVASWNDFGESTVS